MSDYVGKSHSDLVAMCMVSERELSATQKKLEAAEAECLEQARLNGMGSEREARLIAENAELTKKLADSEKTRRQYFVEMCEMIEKNDKLIAEAKSNSQRYKFLRRISDEPELIEFLNVADENPQSPDGFDAAIDKVKIAAAKQLGGSNE